MILTVDDNVIRAIGIIWEGDGVYFTRVLNEVERIHDNITIKLHTFGGSVFDGNLIYNVCNTSTKIDRIEIIGIAASMGAIISQSRKKVLMVKNGFMMIHPPSGYANGTAKDLKATVNLLEQMEKNFCNDLSATTGKTTKWIQENWLDGSDHWFSAEQALKENLIDGIIENETEVDRFDPSEINDENEVYARYAALYIPNNVNNNSTQKAMKQPLIQALGLQGVNEQSSDTAVIDAVKAKNEADKNQLQAELAAEKQKVSDLEAKLTAQSENAITAFLDEKEKAGAFQKEHRKTYEDIGKSSGIEALQTILGNAPVQHPSIYGQIINGSGKENPIGGRETWTFAQWQENDPKGLEKLSQEKPEEFEKLFNARKTK